MHFGEPGREREREQHISAFMSFLKLDWHEAIYLGLGLLAHRCRRWREKRGRLKSLLSRICDQWQAVPPSPSPPVSINSELSGQSPLDFTSIRLCLIQKDTVVFKVLILPPPHTPAREGHCYSISVFLFYSMYSQSNTSSCASNMQWGKILYVEFEREKNTNPRSVKSPRSGC